MKDMFWGNGEMETWGDKDWKKERRSVLDKKSGIWKRMVLASHRCRPLRFPHWITVKDARGRNENTSRQKFALSCDLMVALHMPAHCSLHLTQPLRAMAMELGPILSRLLPLL